MRQQLRRLIKGGLEFNDCVLEFGVARDENKFAKLAYEQKCRAGEIEIDGRTVVSGLVENGGSGAYVMAWVWIDNPDYKWEA
jgi:hypothetical protein